MKALLVLGFLLAASPAAAQAVLCRPFEAMKVALLDLYHERQIGAGYVSEQQIYLLFASEEGKTWTILTLNPAGLACAIASGASWTADFGA